MERLGTHALANFYGCNPEVLRDVCYVNRILHDVSYMSGFKVVGDASLKNPARGIIVLEASHFSFHALPEYGAAIVDIFTCDDEKSPEVGLDNLVARLEHKRVEKVILPRGSYGLSVDLDCVSDPTFGTHAFGEFYGCKYDDVAFVRPVRQMMNFVIDKAGFIPVADVFHQFDPVGVTGIIMFGGGILGGGHFTIHTWPERRAVAVDMLQYGKCPSALDGLSVLKDFLYHKDCNVRQI